MTLRGIKVIEMAGLAPVPFAGMILADFGARVIRVDKMNQAQLDTLSRNKRSVAVNLKHSEGNKVIKKLCADADVLIEGYRPGVMEKLGLGPDVMLALNPRLIYSRLTGFGQSGSHAHKAGHDINYLAISGILSMLGRKTESPYAPVNLLADFAGGSMFCVTGILLALIERQKSNKGQVIDSAMVDGCAYLGSFLNTSKAIGIWSGGRGENMLDGGAPFYNTYKTADNKYVAVGAIEPQFYQAFLQGLGIDDSDLPPQLDESSWETMKERFAKIILTKSRDEWIKVFSKFDACFEPVLEIDEAFGHPHNESRHFYQKTESGIESMPAPKLGMSQTIPGSFKQPGIGEHTVEILSEHYSHNEISDLIANDIVYQNQAPASKL